MTAIKTDSDATITDLSIVTNTTRDAVHIEVRYSTADGGTWEGEITETALFGLLAGAGHIERRRA